MLERQSSKKYIGVGADAIIVGGTIGAMAGGTIGDIAGVIITAAGIPGVTITRATGARGSASTSASDAGRSVTQRRCIADFNC